MGLIRVVVLPDVYMVEGGMDERVEYVFKVLVTMMKHGIKGSRGNSEMRKDDC